MLPAYVNWVLVTVFSAPIAPPFAPSTSGVLIVTGLVAPAKSSGEAVPPFSVIVGALPRLDGCAITSVDVMPGFGDAFTMIDPVNVLAPASVQVPSNTLFGANAIPPAPLMTPVSEY